MKSFFKKLDVQIIAPILIISIIGALIGGHLIEKRIVQHIEINTKSELDTFINKIYFVTDSNYRSLFNLYGTNENEFHRLEPIVQKETLEAIRLLLEKDMYYETYILSPTDEQLLTHGPHHLTHHLPSPEGKWEDSRGDLYYTSRDFLPWKWKIITIDHFERHNALIDANIEMVFGTIAAIITSIIAFLLIVFYKGIKQPFNQISNQLEAISSGDYSTHHLEASTEVSNMVQKLNRTASIIANREEKIKHQLAYTKSILNSQESIVLITDSQEGLIEANDQLFQFLMQYDSLDDFRIEHDCICDFFEDIGEADYIPPPPKESPRIYWVSHVVTHLDQNWKVAMKKSGEMHYFSVKANRILHDDSSRDIIVFTDISDAENYRRHLEQLVQEQTEKNRQQDKYIFEQERRYATTELLSNIAHHWRQPLSAISITTSNIVEMIQEGEGDQKALIKMAKNTEEITQNLSKTINIFTDFERKRTGRDHFTLKECLNSVNFLLSATLAEQKMVLELPEECDITLYGNIHNFEEAIMKIINNMIRVAQEKEISHPTARIEYQTTKQKTTIRISDNLGGIPEKILPVIFDPYTTTEFKSQGKGLGLFVTKSIIEKNFQGDIYAENSKEGAVFTIELPLKENREI